MNKSILFFSFFILLFISCDDGDDNHDYTEKLDYWNTMNQIGFKNFDTFIPTYKRVFNMNETEYNTWCDSLSNFQSYQHFWDAINKEYETLKTEADYLTFKETYKEFVKFSDKTIDGLPDYSFEPSLINTSLMRLVNKEGFIVINGKTYDVKKTSVIPGLKSLPDPRSCYKKDGRRKMWVRIDYNETLNNHIAHVNHKKKVTFAWVGYKTKYTIRHHKNNFTFTTPEMSNGSDIVVINGTPYGNIGLDIWNRGVGENDMCTFSWFHNNL